MKKPALGTRVTTTTAIVVVAAIVTGLLVVRQLRDPWTRDGQVQAQVIMIAPRVTGTVVEVAVVDNQPVARDDVLFRIDPSDFELAVASARVALQQARDQVQSLEAAVGAAEAGVREAEAAVTTADAQIESARATVTSAEGQVAAAQARLRSARASIAKAEAQLVDAVQKRDRAKRLADDGAGSVANAESTAAAAAAAEATVEGAQASLDEAQATFDQAEAGLRQAGAGLSSAEAGRVEAEARLASAEADLVKARADLGARGEQNVRIESAKVSLARAELDLERSVIRAPMDGYVVNLNVDVGDYASPGTAMLAFVDGASFHVQGYFRETQLRRIAPGDRAIVTLMSHRGTPIEGVVESIGWAINPPDVATTAGASGLVPQVEPSFDWIRLAQRVPVRIGLGEIPDDVQLVSGTTVSVAIRPER
jgi:multidrug resistance efflux pump